MAGQHHPPPELDDVAPELEEIPPELEELAPELDDECPPEPDEVPPELVLEAVTPELDAPPELEPAPELDVMPPEPDDVTGSVELSRSPIVMNPPLQPAVVERITPTAASAPKESETNVRVMAASSLRFGMSVERPRRPSQIRRTAARFANARNER